MRIAYVVGSFPTRSETFIMREAAALADSGAEVEVVSLWRPKERVEWAHPRVEVRQWPGWSHTAFRVRSRAEKRWQSFFASCLFRRWRSSLSALWWLPRAALLATWLEKQGVERVHAHFANVPSTVGWVAAAMAELPFTFAVHARDVFVEPQFVAEKARAAVRVVACNSAAAARAREMAGEQADKVVLVHHGLPLDQYPFRGRQRSDKPLVLAVGRLVEKKGFRWLIRALEVLRRRHLGLRCRIIGDGPLRKDLAREAQTFAVADIVDFAGWLPHDQVVAAYRQADVFVAPSVVAADGDRDGLPNVVVEAAAVGVPLVATNVGGLGDLVREGETGLVAEPADPASLARRLEEALSDPDAAYRRAERARAEVEARFDQKTTIPALIEALTA